MIPNVLVSISGLPKTGKTHLAFTFPEPIKVFSFDGGADYVRTKFPDKAVDITNFQMPLVESEDDSSWAPPIWDAFYKEYKKSVNDGGYQTLVIDTASTVHTILNQAVFEWLREEAAEAGKSKKKLAVNEYHTRNLLMKALFDLPRNRGVNLVTIQYLGEKWATPPGGKMPAPTGETKLQGWAQTEAFADVNIEMTTKEKIVQEGSKPARKTVMVATIISTRFDRDQIGQSFEDTTYEEIIALLLGG